MSPQPHLRQGDDEAHQGEKSRDQHRSHRLRRRGDKGQPGEPSEADAGQRQAGGEEAGSRPGPSPRGSF